MIHAAEMAQRPVFEPMRVFVRKKMMRNSGDFLQAGRLAMLLALGVAFVAGAPSRALARSKPGKGATVYIVRGINGYFPNLNRIVNEKFESRGLVVIDCRVNQRARAAQEIIASHRAGGLPHGVMLVGYSAGGPASIDIATDLKEAGVPIRLLFLIETVRPNLAVPANVEGCFNLYHSPSIVFGPVRAVSAKTKIFNCKARKNAGFGMGYSHFTIPWVDGVHELVAEEVVNAVQRRPLGEGVTNRLRLKAAKANDSKAKAKPRKKPKAKVKAKGR